MVKPLPICLIAPLAVMLLAPIALAQSYTFFMEPREGPIELDVRQPDIAVHRITFKLSGQDVAYKVRIEKSDNDLEWIYDIFRISTDGMEAEPQDVVIELKVNKSWIDENNVELSTIALNYYDGLWKRLPATPFAEDPDFMYFSSESPKLNTSFALSGEPVPVLIGISSPCNGNDVCEPERGEDSENCPDCVTLSQTICVPAEKYCSGDSLFECSADGTGYTLEPCVFGCADGACLLSLPGATAGMAVAQNPLFVAVVAALLAVILLLAVIVRRMRSELLKVERRKGSNEEVKKLVKS